VRKTRLLAIGLAGVLVPLALATGGLTPLAEAAEPTPIASVSETPTPSASETPTPTPSPVVPVEVVHAGSLALSPVANASRGSITATFTGAAKVKYRPTYLYSASTADGPWTRISSKVKLSSSGVAVFKVTPVAGTFYKVVAPAYRYKVKKKYVTALEADTAPRQLSDDWTAELVEDFNGDALNPTYWKPTAQDENRAGGRECSVPKDANATVSGGQARLAMSKADQATASWVVAAAKARQQAAKDAAIKAAVTSKQKKAAAAIKVTGCPNGVYTNARVSTENGRYQIKTGIVATEITFPIYQGGHGGVWLRTANNSAGKFDEIDLVEAFGWKKGIQAVLHLGTNTTYETPEKSKWVAKSAVGKTSWWGKPHIFSIEFTRSQVIYRLDGSVTRTEKRSLPDAEYSIVMSMLSSDWETPRLKKPSYGGKKGVKLPMSTTVNWIKTWVKAS